MSLMLHYRFWSGYYKVRVNHYTVIRQLDIGQLGLDKNDVLYKNGLHTFGYSSASTILFPLSGKQQ